MSDDLKAYTFDVKMFAAIRVKAESEDAARELVRENLECADCNGGAWPDGSPILFEASVDDDELPCLRRVLGLRVRDESPRHAVRQGRKRHRSP